MQVIKDNKHIITNGHTHTLHIQNTLAGLFTYLPMEYMLDEEI